MFLLGLFLGLAHTFYRLPVSVITNTTSVPSSVVSLLDLGHCCRRCAACVGSVVSLTKVSTDPFHTPAAVAAANK